MGGDCEWISDGEGGRYCENCHASHPDNLVPYPDELEQKNASEERARKEEARTQQSKLIKAIGAAMRAADALNQAQPNRTRHTQVLNNLRSSCSLAQDWNPITDAQAI